MTSAGNSTNKIKSYKIVCGDDWCLTNKTSHRCMEQWSLYWCGGLDNVILLGLLLNHLILGWRRLGVGVERERKREHERE